jgi:light-regulated signal transduction histidine kinase (bacteriophytochrome)
MEGNLTGKLYPENECDKEPIHQLGRVQSFGFFVSVDSQGVITHISSNAKLSCSLNANALLGTSLWELIGREASHSLRGALHQSTIINKPCRIYSLSLPTINTLFDVSVHQNGMNAIFEFEESNHTQVQDNILAAMMNQITGPKDLQDLFDVLVTGIKVITGFDRVMVYQFLDDGSGEVIAEMKESDMSSFLGLRYPASDIPKQARALYKKNLIRLITDVNSETYPILSVDDKSALLDLSFSRTRAVSEIHIQYLKNMGVGASMSISIIVDGELWGLIACHHNTARHLTGRTLEELELFGELFSLELARRLVMERIIVSERANATFAKVLSNLSVSHSLTLAIVEQLDLIKNLIDVDGIACAFNGEFQHNGASLSEKKINILIEVLQRRPEAEFYQLDNLVAADKRLTDKHVAGVLALQISKLPLDYIFLFRMSAVQEVSWAGNPQKSLSNMDTRQRLTPRTSFEKWIETNGDKSNAWTALDVERAKSIRLGIMELTIRHLHEKETLQREANERLELLIGELNHRVRNILNLVGAIIGQTSQKKENLDEFVASLSSRISALALGHDQLTHSSWNSISFKTLLINELKAYMVNEAAFTILGPNIKITSYAVTPIVLVFHELITNAAKYGALSATSSDGTVSVTWALDNNQNILIFWKEFGGPPLAKMDTDGFGMTVIKSVIPHELGGEVKFSPQLSGLQAQFTIPKKYIEVCKGEEVQYPPEDTPKVTTKTRLVASDDNHRATLGRAFVIEDNLLISLDLQKKLRRVGFKYIDVYGDVIAAKTALKKVTPQIVFLDVHLGQENSFNLGEELKKQSIPFLFITGYGAGIALPEPIKDVDVLTKPVDSQVLQKAIMKNIGEVLAND